MNRGSFFYDLLSTLFERKPVDEANGDGRAIRDLCIDLMTNRGEISGNAIARQILSRFRQLDEAGEISFFNFLTEEMDIDPDKVLASANAYRENRTPENLAAFLTISEPRRQELLRRINRVPGATGSIVNMRSHLLKYLRQNPAFARTDLDFQHLFASWFNRGFLIPRRIHWQTPANILEKIIEYEAVHAINDWSDLRRRVEPEDRRCYAFFHPSMPDDPLIFVEVALSKGIPNSVQQILAEDRKTTPIKDADTAVFYSISNCQKGLRGVSFGNSLIKQVVQDLQSELAHISTFVTLSPVPGFRKWLEMAADKDDAAHAMLTIINDAIQAGTSNEPVSADLEANSETLRRMVAYYLLTAKDSQGLPLDPVAKFHLNNGALLHNVHVMADNSNNGLRQSGGAMVNYLYDLKKIEQYHEGFAGNATIAAAKVVRQLSDSFKTKNKTRISRHG